MNIASFRLKNHRNRIRNAEGGDFMKNNHCILWDQEGRNRKRKQNTTWFGNSQTRQLLTGKCFLIDQDESNILPTNWLTQQQWTTSNIMWATLNVFMTQQIPNRPRHFLRWKIKIQSILNFLSHQIFGSPTPLTKLCTKHYWSVLATDQLQHSRPGTTSITIFEMMKSNNYLRQIIWFCSGPDRVATEQQRHPPAQSQRAQPRVHTPGDMLERLTEDDM